MNTKQFSQKFYLLRILSVLVFVIPFAAKSADIVINFCPITKIQASKEWSATVQIQNNSGIVLDLTNNKFTFNWPSLVSLAYPFTNGSQTGTTWSFGITLNWPGTMAVGATSNFTVNGNHFSGVLQFPTSGTFTQNGKTFTVEIKNCNETQNYELFDATFDFKRECFLYSPAKICLGQGATEIWKGEGVFDAMIPTNRPTWAIGVMVGHRLFTNLVHQDIVSPNFWMATAMNESRMTCDPQIAPNLSGGHLPINGNANTGTGVYNPTNNCFQVLNIGYSQISNNQPDLFSQTNAYGTATFSNVVDNGNWETGAIALAYYHYQDMRYWDQIYCFDILKTWKDSKDPYAIEKIFYHAYHDGPNAGIALLNDIKANYTAATSATNMNTVITTGGTWSQIISGGSSQKVGNFTYLLDGNNGTIYPCSKTDYTTQYLGCYNDAIKWTDVVFYLDRIKILYPKLQQSSVQNAIKAVFNGINGGNNVNFSDLGKVIDEIVIQMGGHDPSKYIATQFSASKVCPEIPLGVSLRTNDTICPGQSGELQVWLSGNKNFKFTLKFPDGSLHTYSNVDHSPFIVKITQPGAYEVVSFEDNGRIGDPNCLFSKLTVQSKNGNIVNWDKTNVSGNPPCTNGPLVIKNIGPDAVDVTYTHNGSNPKTVTIPAGTASYTVSTAPLPGQYIITTMSPNKCGSPVNDTINICSNCIKPVANLTGNASICAGDSAKLTVNFSGGAGPYTIKINDGVNKWKVLNIPGPVYSFYANHAGTYVIDSVWNAACDTLGTGKAIVTVNASPSLVISGDTSICPGDVAKLNLALSGQAPYNIVATMGTTSIPFSTSLNNYQVSLSIPGSYTLNITDGNGCKTTKKTTIIIAPLPTVDLGPDLYLCYGNKTTIDAGNGFASYTWSGAGSGTSQTIVAAIAGNYVVKVKNSDGCKALDSVKVNINPKINMAFANDSITICPGDSIKLSVNPTGGLPGYTYTWGGLASGTASTFTAGAIGLHTLTISDTKNCTANDSVYIVTNNKLSIKLNDISICKGDSILLDCGYDASNYIITWNTGANTQTIYATTAGTYSVYVTNGGACNGQDDMTLTLNPLPDLSSIPLQVSVCKGTTAALGSNLGNGFSYTWIPGNSSNPILNTNIAGNYSLTVTNTATNCKNNTIVQLSLLPLPLVNLQNNIDTCMGSMINLLFAGAQTGLSYNWTQASTGNTTIGNTPTLQITNTNTYYLEVTDANGCKNRDSVKALFRPIPVVKLLDGKDSVVICSGKTLNLNAGNTGLNYFWLPGGQTSQSITAYSTGWYTAVVSDGNCKAKDSVYLQTVTLPKYVLQDTLYAIQPNYCFAELTSGIVLSALAADNKTYAYLWSPGGQTSQSIIITSGGTYEVSLSLRGCAESDAIKVIDYCETTFYVPNAFSPNNDEINNIFAPKGMYVNDYKMMIYNRWGELIFESDDINIGWDGKYKGNKAQEDVYLWRINYSENLETGKTRSLQKTGTVTLLR